MLGPLYHADGDLLVPTELTRGPWDPRAQHGGAPAAALGRLVERCEPRGHVAVSRIAVELLRPVPIAPLRGEARILRGGKRIQLVEATLSDGDGPVARATAWRMRLTEPVLPAAGATPPPPPPEAGRGHGPRADLPGLWTAVEWRFVDGDFATLGPATGWCRLNAPLVDDEEASPLARTLLAADFGNGISGVLDFARHLFVNVDLTVHLHRMPEGPWIGVAAATAVDPRGIGLTTATLYDASGAIGASAQSLLVEARPG